MFPWLEKLVRRSTAQTDVTDQDPLLAFDSESPTPTDERSAPRAENAQVASTYSAASRSWTPVAVVAAVVALAGVAGFARLRGSAAPAAPAAAGKLTVETRPPGAEVWIDGERRGATPIALSLAAGSHTLRVGEGDDERVVPVRIGAGAELTERLDMKPPEAARPVAADVPRAAPAEAAPTSGSAAAPVGGWLALTAPFEVQVLERNEVVGTSAAPKFMLAAGHHEVVLANDALGYRESRRLDVVAGKTASIRVDAPKTSISLNALPWADVVIDGVSLGQTPIANAAVTIGRHQVTFRHPDLGERSQTITATRPGPNRFSVDLTK